jgi:hypothetical protein
MAYVCGVSVILASADEFEPEVAPTTEVLNPPAPPPADPVKFPAPPDPPPPTTRYSTFDKVL